MEFDKVIEKRRSTREFSSKKVKKEDVFKLLDSARLSPSAANRQPWHFVVLEGKIKEQVANIMEQQIKNVTDIFNSKEETTHPYNPTNSVYGSIKVIKEVPIFILVFRENNDNWKEGDYLSIGSAVEHICLKATDLGIATLWIRDVVYTRDKITKFLHKENLELVTGLAVGYSIEYPYERYKKKLEDIMEWKKDE